MSPKLQSEFNPPQPIMTKPEIIQRILHPGIVAIIRADSSEPLIPLAGALADGGVTTMEITMTTPNALQVISDAVKKFGDRILMGAGSVLDSETCRAAILAGAGFVVTPVTKAEVIRVCNRYGKPIISGAYSPTEALFGYESGADFIKIFPADQLGPAYIKNLLAPMPMLQIIPTGGVTVDTAASFIHAGCAALAAGSSLVGKDALQNRDWKKITAAAAAFVEAVKNARSGKK
jgi:2-dehydro-3-deoxyphosphogluconate aldolase/(4S)-4-hydroxy-2-oxoglutarate aldolase